MSIPTGLSSTDDHVATCRERRWLRSRHSVYVSWQTRSTCSSSMSKIQGGHSSIDMNWKREYEEHDCALTLREEVADGRSWSTGSEWPGGLKTGGLAGLSAPASMVTSFPCGESHNNTRPIERRDADFEVSPLWGEPHCPCRAGLRPSIARGSPGSISTSWSLASQAPTTGSPRGYPFLLPLMAARGVICTDITRGLA